ncbi:MAG TPA: hypothetical protein VGB53_06865 [Rubricoccaceae bacterium]|jgi:hypothetical protein
MPIDGFAVLSLDCLGLAADPRRPDVRRTAVGTYRLVRVAPCAVLDRYGARVGAEACTGGGLLVVGTCEAPDQAVAVLVLGPLVQVRLRAVPWAWIRSLTTPATDPLRSLATPEPTVAPARPLHTLPQRERRMPSWRSPKPTTRRRGARRATERAAV